MTETYAVPAEAGRFQQRALWVGVSGLFGCAVGLLVSREQFFRSYLVSYLFLVGIALGCLAVLMLQHLTGGSWGIVIRRLLESGTRTIPLLAALFLPIVLGVHHLYVWSRQEEVAASEILRHKQAYLNVPFFVLRAVLYFALWVVMTLLLNRWSLQQDRNSDPALTRRLQLVSGPGLGFLALSVTFAAVDWVMSLEPEWYSTIFGLLLLGGHALSALAFVIAVAALLATRKPLSAVLTPEHFHDLGKLLLAFVMVWAYFSFSQFLIIWSGNLPEEIPWYLRRLQGGWQWIALALVVFHFVLPFLLLLSRDVKRSRRRLAVVATAVVCMRFVDLFWLIVPEFHQGKFHVHWLDLAALAGLGGIWLAFFTRSLRDRPLLPLGDPYLREALHVGRH